MRDLQLHRPGLGGAVRRRGRCGARREPDQQRDEPSAPRPAARPAAGRGAQPGARLRRSGAVRAGPGLFGRRAGRAGGPHQRAAGRSDRAARSLWQPPQGGPVRRQGRRRGDPARHRRACACADQPQAGWLVASGACGQHRARAERAGNLRRDPPQGPAPDGRQGAGRGLHDSAGRGALPQGQDAHASRAGAVRTAGRRSRFRFRRGCGGRGADPGQRRRRGRQGADRGRVRL